MIDPRLMLLAHFDGYNYDRALADYAGSYVFLPLIKGGYFYLGYRKPFNACYVEMYSPRETSNTIGAEYWDGEDWVECLDYVDETDGLTRSGFMQWRRSQPSWAATTVAGREAFWVRFSTDYEPGGEETDTPSVQGISLTLSCDDDIRKEVPFICDDAFLMGRPSHVLIHEAVRDQIIQELRNRGLIKIDAETGTYTRLNPWDLLDIHEVSQAARCLALSKVFFNASDSPGDKWGEKADYYEKMYRANMELAFLSYDKNDDGLANDSEKSTSIITGRIVR